MANILADRVKETSSTTGTGSFALTGALSGFKTFASRLATSDTTYYCAVNGAEWEVGLGTLTGATTLARTTVLSSSNADAAVNFTVGPTIFITLPASAAPAPAFSATPSSGQAVPATTTTQLLFQTEQFDTRGAFNNTASSAVLNGLTVPAYSFMPDIPGYYQVNLAIEFVSSLAYQYVHLYKNGASFLRNSNGSSVGTGTEISALVYLNGSTDYLGGYTYIPSAINSLATGGTFFQAFLARSA